MRDGRDDAFYETLYDAEEKPRRVLKEHIEGEEDSSGWTDYDTSHGHCGLCGSISCNGNCFK